LVTGRGRLAGIVVFAAVASAPGPALAQQAPPDQTPDQAPAQQDAAASNVTAYKPDFFTQFRPNTAMDMVGRIPGFSFDGGSDARGFSGTAGNVLIDGERPPSRGDSLFSVIARIPASGVERIDIIRGGAEGIDMQGKPIIANIIRKKDAGLTGSLSSNANVNSFGGVSPNATLTLRNQSGANLFDGSIGLFRNQGNGASRRWRVSPAGDVLFIGFSGSDNVFQSAEVTGAWETTWLGGKLRINGKAQLEQFDGVTEESLVVPVGKQISDDLDTTNSGEAGIRFTRSIGGAEVELVGFQSYRANDFEGTFDTPTFTSSSIGEGTSGESIARATVRLPAAGQWTFDGGSEGVFNFSESSSARSLNGAPFDLTGDQNHVEELRGELFGTATWAPSSKLSVETGLRYEASRIKSENDTDSSEKSLNFFKPRVNISWSPAEGHQWGLQVERVVDQLDFDGFASSASFENEIFGVGNVELEPEKNWVVDARYERQFGGQNSIVVEIHHATIEDYLGRTVITIPAVPATPTTPAMPEQIREITRNTGTATRDSLELESSFELDRFGMPGGILELGADLRTSHVTDPVTGEERELSNYEPWSWNVSLQQTLANGAFRWAVFLEDDADFQSWQPRSYTYGHNGTFLGGNVTWKPIPNWTFGGGINNIIAEDGTNYSIFYTAPRNVGVPQYRQDQTFESRRQFFVNARVNF